MALTLISTFVPSPPFPPRSLSLFLFLRARKGGWDSEKERKNDDRESAEWYRWRNVARGRQEGWGVRVGNEGWKTRKKRRRDGWGSVKRDRKKGRGWGGHCVGGGGCIDRAALQGFIPSLSSAPTNASPERALYTQTDKEKTVEEYSRCFSLSLSLSFSTPLLLMRTPPLLPFSLYLISLVFSSPLIFSSFPPCLSRLNISSFSRYHRLPSFVIRLSLFASPFNLFLRWYRWFHVELLFSFLFLFFFSLFLSISSHFVPHFSTHVSRSRYSTDRKWRSRERERERERKACTEGVQLSAATDDTILVFHAILLFRPWVSFIIRES